MTTLFIALCCAVFWAAFCRLVHMNARTRLSIRAAFWATACTSAWLVGETLLGWYVPHLQVVTAVGAFAAVLVATGRRWFRGVPPDYERHPTTSG